MRPQISGPCSTASRPVTRSPLGELFSRYRDRLGRMIQFRLDGRLKGRIATSDVLQEAYIDALKRLPHYQADRGMPFLIWLRWVTMQRLVEVHRQHLGARMRDAGREVSLDPGGSLAASSEKIAEFIGDLTSPSQAAERAETMDQLRAALDGLEPTDREVLALRHFEELSNLEAAAVLGIQPAAASKRYVRALERLKGALEKLQGFGRGRPMTESGVSEDIDATSDHAADPAATSFDRVAEEFAERCRRGESPAIGEYAGGIPQHAGKIRELLPSVAMMETAQDGRVARAASESVGRPPRAPPRAAGRVPDRPRAGPRRHGDRLRGGPGVARPPRRAQGDPPPRAARRQAAPAVPARGAGRRAAPPHQHRADLRRRRARRAAVLRDAVHPGQRPRPAARNLAARRQVRGTRPLAIRRPGRRPGGGGPPVRPRPGHPAPRHQAGEPADR